MTIVWKFSSASSRPCAISAWYGVYGVYQPGFSRMFRWITGGVMRVVVAQAEVRAQHWFREAMRLQRAQHLVLALAGGDRRAASQADGLAAPPRR